MASSINGRLNPCGKGRLAWHRDPSIVGALFARWAAQSLSFAHALEFDITRHTGRSFHGAVYPRLDFHALGMHGTVCVNESLHQNNIAGLEPTRQTVHGATFDVRENGRSVRVNVGMLPLGVDNNLVHLEPKVRFKVIAARLIGAEHRPTNAGFRTLCFQQNFARSFSGDFLCSSYTKKDRLSLIHI